MIKRFLFIGLAIFTTHIEAQGQWQFTNGPFGSDIRDLVIDPQHPDTLFAATIVGEGLYKTENGGESWIGMNIDSNLTRVYALAMAPDDPNTIYAGGDSGIDKTEDGGNSWYHLNLAYYIYALAVDPTNSSTIYAGSSGVLKSNDGGSTWVSMNNGLPTDPISGIYPWVRAIAVNPINPEVIYIGIGTYLGFAIDGLYKSTDAGSSWVYIAFNNHFFFDIVIDQNNPEVIYAATDRGFYRSLNGGLNWSVLFSGSAQSIAIDPTNSEIMYCGTGSAVFLSTNGGSTWMDISYGLSWKSADVQTITINPQNSNVVYIGTKVGVYKAVNESYNWMPKNEGFTRQDVFLLSVAESDSGAVIYVGDQVAGVHKSVNGGQTWSYAGLVGPISLAAAPSNPNLVFAAQLNIAIESPLYKTIDGGVNWEHTGLSRGAAIKAIAIDPFNSNLVYAGGFAKSYNGGDDWDIYEGPNSSVNCISIATQNTQILYAGTLNGVYKSTNEGIDWNFSGMSDKNVLTIALDPLDSNIVYAGVLEEGIFKSIDAGLTWYEINEGLTNLNVLSLIVHQDKNNRLYAGTSGGGVFESLNGGTNWSETNEGLDNLYVGGLAFDPTDLSRIYAATGGGVYIYSEPTGIEANPSDELPSSFTLFQNYPNPFNSSTIITYTLAEKSFVNLTVYDVLGKEVASLVKENKPSGKHSVKFNALNLPSGIYFYRIVSGNFSATKKLILIK